MHIGPRRIDAIMIARYLGLTPEFEADLRRIVQESAQSQDEAAARAASCAVSALTDITSANAVEALLECLDHRDDRVRANAVEALARKAQHTHAEGKPTPTLHAVLAELKLDESHRVRANAIRAMIRTAEGESSESPARALSAMLSDDRPMHRVAGLWVVDRAIVSGQANAIGDSSIQIALALDTLAKGDVEPKVRDRAAHCAGRLLGATRESWSRRAANVIVETKGVVHAAA
jgi:HEAT repeat protein